MITRIRYDVRIVRISAAKLKYRLRYDYKSSGLWAVRPFRRLYTVVANKMLFGRGMSGNGQETNP